MRNLVLALVLISSPASATIKDWDTKTKVQFGITSALIVSDFITTRDATHNTDLVETNPLLGKHPSDLTIVAYTALSVYGNYYAFDNLNEKQRMWYFIGNTLLRSWVLNNNLSLGAELKF